MAHYTGRKENLRSGDIEQAAIDKQHLPMYSHQHSRMGISIALTWFIAMVSCALRTVQRHHLVITSHWYSAWVLNPVLVC